MTQSVFPANLPRITGSGSLTAQDQAVTIVLAGQANVTFQLSGTWVGTLTFEASNDNFSNTSSIYGLRAGDNLLSTTATANDIYRCTVAGFGYVRIRCSSFTSGTIIVTAIADSATSGVFLNLPVPPGGNLIGGTTIYAGTTAASVTNPVYVRETDGTLPNEEGSMLRQIAQAEFQKLRLMAATPGAGFIPMEIPTLGIGM